MPKRALTYVQQRIVEVRAERRALLERAAAKALHSENVAEEPRSLPAVANRSFFRGEVEPEVVFAEDGSVRLAPLEWATEGFDSTEQ